MTDANTGVWLLPNGNVLVRTDTRLTEVEQKPSESNLMGTMYFRDELPEGAVRMTPDPAAHSSAERLGNGKLWLMPGGVQWDADVDVEVAQRLFGEAEVAAYVAVDRLAAVRAGLEFLQALPATVGERLLEELSRRNWTQGEFADIIGRPVQMVSEIATGKKELTRETAGQFAAALGLTPEFWLGAQNMYALARLRRNTEFQRRLDDIRKRAETAAARRKVLADLAEPGVYLMRNPDQDDRVALVTPDGRLLVKWGPGPYFSDATHMYPAFGSSIVGPDERKPDDRWTFTLMADRNLSPVVTDGE